MTSVLLSEDEKDNLIIRLRTLVEEYRKEIAELEAQVPKVVKPEVLTVGYIGTLYICPECQEKFYYGDYCSSCGSKFDWSEA